MALIILSTNAALLCNFAKLLDMRIVLDTTISSNYKSPSQKIRVMTEHWVETQVYCPSCGRKMQKYPNNNPVGDFYCPYCSEDYELKSKKGHNLPNKIVNGAYKTMIKRLKCSHNPNFFFLNYESLNYNIINFIIIPKHFFIPNIIEKRKPLSRNARRAGWIGCNILLSDIPNSGKIFYIRNRQVEPKEKVLEKWKKTLFLRETKKNELKGWILDIMNCIDALNKQNFTLSEMYSFEKILAIKHPNNKHIKDKIRQQLQFLRDKGYIEFLGNGKYKLI